MRVQRASWFVGKNDFWIEHQCPVNADPLLLANGQFAGPIPCSGRDTNLGQGFPGLTQGVILCHPTLGARRQHFLPR